MERAAGNSNGGSERHGVTPSLTRTAPPAPLPPQDGESEKAAGHSRIGEGIVT